MQTRRNTKKQGTSLRLVGALVALFRANANFTQHSLSERLCIHEETIASIEQGRRRLLPDMADELDRVLETGGALAVAVEHLPEREKYPVWAEAYMAHEKEAIALSWYENQVVPGLLQTEGYARATFQTTVPPLTEDERELRVAARLERQVVLHRNPPVRVSFVISEAALISHLGGQEVMREQLRHLRDCADLDGVSIQAMPLNSETHAGLSGPFILLETPEYQQFAYTETQLGSQLISDSDGVSTLAGKYGMLRTQALNLKETQSLLDGLLGET
ncbi:helix-turn-helix domain-containing protein [Streptomyces netropsis]|uniref:Transcriptional regulator with XRE-family HTH domain n=1 Tax=Streptomyces netropsis TaxID=55404 RepID=A0A7W7LJ92_STRNE|nr:helix-turn-helix transcriptional regulator [Streptomyces netropsis]MBB4890636.1 transcriptional regulator with XRE-family HTH domain [Streptomyces netropsis]GGR49388.1 transcriptional regulator [Streptomyces netropsis]